MISAIARLKIVYLCLMLVTVVSLGLTSDAAHSRLSVQGVVSVAAVIAFIKARYVVLEFMELRGTKLQTAFDLWLLVVGVGSLVLAFR